MHAPSELIKLPKVINHRLKNYKTNVDNLA